MIYEGNIILHYMYAYLTFAFISETNLKREL
jgi:hypothetical protein